jgi:flagellar biosynthesis/type III secretory pathway chaperone
MQPEFPLTYAAKLALAERLLALTYAVVASIEQGEVEDLSALLDARQELLNQFCVFSRDEQLEEFAEKIRHAEQKVIQSIQDQKSSLAQQVQNLFAERRGAAAYRRQA